MLKNDRQVAIARERLNELKAARNLASDSISKGSFDSLISDVASEIVDYESIKDGSVRCFGLSDLDDLGPAVVKARIANGATQRSLADELGVTEQMVQKDERRCYETAGISRLADVLDILGYEVVGEVRPKSRKTDGILKLDLQNSMFKSSLATVSVEVAEVSDLTEVQPTMRETVASSVRFLGFGVQLHSSSYLSYRQVASCDWGAVTHENVGNSSK